VNGPKRFFWYSLYESDRTGAPIAVRNRALGSIDAYAAWVGRWLVTRDGFDLLVYYLPDYDFASHASGPAGARQALERSDAAIGALLDAAGGPDAFLERYAVIVCSDHGQSNVDQVARLDAGSDLVTASNRAAMVYTDDPRGVAERLDDQPAAGIVCFREGDRVVVRRHGDEDDAISTTFPTGTSAPPRRSPIRTPATCSSPRRRGTSSSTWPGGITSAAAATARSTRPTPRSRC
jgi:hypothetical protein